ncbi:type IV pilus assembly protein PilY1 [Pelomonas saccharophila]|uniref:Type IV pilus assembly protein PilY1 n=1 Tax=Roseateles saccharophilus TaxID=304 RepID=A0ABU1YJI8_ROSSA|nr:PilC/PilY family type IV pilus protein [Roseateles saccharophilus]MDR7269017.1 type IV pilus assembly protein PilY1 [Roseateles saccharophilus]
MVFRSPRPLIRAALAVLLTATAHFSNADVIDVSQSPLIVTSQDSVKANLLFILDDSGSMNFDFLPDHINGDGSPDPALCRSSGATPVNSGNFNNTCCIGGNSSAACWTGAAPFGSLRGQPPFLAASFNGLAYDPAVNYKPPIKADNTYWPSQTRTQTSNWTSVKNDAYNVQNTGSINLTTQFPDTEWCVDSSYTDCLRNDNYILPGTVNSKAYTVFHATVATGTGAVATGAPDNPSVTLARPFGPHYYNIVAAEYCNGVDLRDCSGTAGNGYVYAAPLRWCKTDADSRATAPAANACQATRNNVFSYARFPTKFFNAGQAGSPEVRAKATFTITANTSCSIQVTAVTVGGLNLMGTATASSTNRGTIGNAIRDSINNKNPASGYTASTSNSGRTVTITAPAGLNTTAQISFTRTPTNCTFPLDNNNPAFSGYAAAVPATPGIYGGSFQRVDIVSSTTSYARPRTRDDCAAIASARAAGNCTYDEEMTNFANWWTYYHSRMQSMKSSAALAFGAVGNNRRVGYMSINNNTGTDFLNLDTFENRTSPAYNQKTNWFNKLTAAIPNNSTPLRSALSKAGKLYAGKYNPINSQGTTLNGVTTVDPVQYSCQRNFTILSTDGFWNETSNPTKLDGTEMGDQDGSLVRPMLDGSATGNTLADVAAYYLNTDLRTGTTGANECKSYSGTNADVCGNGNTSPDILLQKMKTFTLGLGASGYMQFSPTYLTDTSGDFHAVKEGSTPNGGVCSWQSSGDCNWPTPVSNTLTTIDDLWHAAVNGGGTYFSASNPTSLYTGLASAINSLAGQVGAAAAATTSNPNVSAGDNQVFISNFISSEWSGELRSQRLDIDTGVVQSGAYDWSASERLDANTSRNIYLFSAGAADKLKAFNWGSLTATEQAYFSLAYVTTTGRALSQFCAFGPYCVSASDQAAAAGQPLVDFLRGDRTNEGDVTVATKYFRQRTHRLGDIVNSEAVYVSSSLVNYNDADYDTFKATVSTRQGVVYVGANDGMLHAFRADTGDEVWAYMPTAVLPNLYKLADKQYAVQHQYSVDGTPVVQDVYINGAWRSILVAGLGAGGRSYYALDVTDPTAPKALWEFTDTNLGLTVGKPEIGKLEDGTWVVIFASGYNNVSPGDGVGRLYVVNAATGALIRSISTGMGSTSTPSGLAHIRGWVENSDLDNTIVRVYAGDNMGNLWRFDVNDNVGAAGYDAQRIATLKSSTGIAQPITSRPELGLVGTYPMVFVGTGRYLGQTDLTDTSAQTIYGIKDNMNGTDIGDPRLTANAFVQQTLTAGTCPANSNACASGDVVRKVAAPNPVNLASNGGWFVDLPQSRERVNTDPQLALGTLVVTSNIIESGNVCKVGGSSWANFLDYRTGAAVDSARGVASVSLGDAIATRPALIKLPNNKVISLFRLSNDSTVSAPTPTPSTSNATRRLSWRDLLQQ